MNRIYQGRVSKVEIPNPSQPETPWQVLPDWQEVLWRHHELFQDAVNYYAFALAVMAKGMTAKDESGKDSLTSMAQFADQVLGNNKPKADDGSVEGRWERFSHRGRMRSGLKDSLARTLQLDPKDLTQEKCVNIIFGHAFGEFPKNDDGRLHDVFRGVVGELFPAKSRGEPQKLANEDPGWLCWRNKGGEPPGIKTYRKQQGIADFMDKLFQADATQLKALSQLSVEESNLSGVAEGSEDASEPEQHAANTVNRSESPEVVGCYVGLEAVAQLKHCISTARSLLQLNRFRFVFARLGGNASKLNDEFGRLDQLVEIKEAEETKSLQESPPRRSKFKFQKWKRQGPGKDNALVELFVLFHCDGGSDFTATLLKTRLIERKLYLGWLLSTDKRRYVDFVNRFGLCGQEEGQEPKEKVDAAEKAAKSGYKPATSMVERTDFIPRLKKKLGYIFPSFTAIRGFAPQKDDPSQANGSCVHGYFGWTKFDNAAYEEAVKAPYQIRQKQQERDKEAKKLDDLKKLYEGKGREKGKADDGEDEGFIPGGFSEPNGDPCFAAMRRIHEALAVSDGADPSRIYRYGISQAALRGYEEVREAWNKEVTPGEPFSDAKARKLKDCIAAYQRQHRDDMGDSRFFEELTKQQNWCVWQSAEPEIQAERDAKRFSTNIVRDYLRYCDVLEELESKRRPVQYTPADARESRRLFDFKGASQGGFEHLANSEGLFLTTQVVMRCSENGNELYRPVAVRIHYTAPRLLRDESRILSEQEDLQSANWAQPLMRGLGLPDVPHDFKKHAVSLMPDWKSASKSPKPERLLLNFVLTPKEDEFIAHLRQEMKREPWPWAMQFNWNGDGHDSTLRWSHEDEDWSKVENKKEFPGRWFDNPYLKSFRLLSVDLGQKQAGAYAIIELSSQFGSEHKKHARFVGKTEHHGERRDWYARVVSTGLLKLPGENTYVLRPDYRDGKPIPDSRDFREELSGAAGRMASPAETAEAIKLLAEMEQLSVLAEDPDKAAGECNRLTFPEQNTKLLIALRRAQSFVGKLHRWCWFLDPQDDIDRKDQAVRRRTALKEIAESEEHVWLDKGAHLKAKTQNDQLLNAPDTPEVHPIITTTLKKDLTKLISKLPGWLEIIANRVYRSRRGRLVWRNQPDKPDCHWLEFSILSKEERNRLSKEERKINGQRGLSMERIEQMESLRAACQRLNQIQRRRIGWAAPASRDDSVPDPCPTILEKLEDIKNQRRNQTAHMILTEALGLTLDEPCLIRQAELMGMTLALSALKMLNSDHPAAKKRSIPERAALKARVEERVRKHAARWSLHGDYVKADSKGQPVSAEKGNVWRGIVDFIVIEDLSRYRTSQGRAPRENSRLMKWCHRAIRDKLKQMCEPFGLPLLETPAAYSSRFCSRTGVGGFRATEISGAPLEVSRWRWRIRRPGDGKVETEDQRKRREQWELLFQQAEAANRGRDRTIKGQQWRTLLVPDAGGSLFVPISKLNSRYVRPPKDADDRRTYRPIVEFEPVDLEENQTSLPRLIHADINAAVNLGLRAVADPRLWSVHSRLRSEREFGTPLATKSKKRKLKGTATGPDQVPTGMIRPDRLWVSEKESRKFGRKTGPSRVQILISSVQSKLEEAEQVADAFERSRLQAEAAASVPKPSDSRHPNFFADFANLSQTDWGAAILSDLPKGMLKPVHLVTGKALWGFVKEQAWQRCMAINAARLQAWGLKPPKEWQA